MKSDIRLINRLQRGRQAILDKKRICLAKGCTNQAIRSHVLQRKGILCNITDETNHFYSICFPSIYDIQTQGGFTIKKVGINEGYSFWGFCKDHDNDIFLPIETHPIDFVNKNVLRLFTYRTICLEYRKKQIYLEQMEDILHAYREFQPKKFHYINTMPALQAIKDLDFYKSQLEEELESDKTNFHYDVIVLNERKICFSSPLSIHDHLNEDTWEYDKYGNERDNPLVASVWNFFPYAGKSYLIIATHSKYRCRWAEEIKQAFKDENNVDQLLSDFLTYRLEFWGMSPSLFKTISEVRINKFLLESKSHWDNYSYKINTNFNLFLI